ncbi:hypothetical protein GALL_137290 [mine drainage metagenome]|uniref:Lipoprotein n=1 Tax=mine drainage metagenome TaxID=410659 RepID=A0A1J5S7G6_9ZZZZ
MKKLILLLVWASLAGCAGLEHQQTFQQSSPTKFPATTNVMVFEYRNVDIHNIYDLLFSDFLIIGKSGFTGSYEDPRASLEFAKSIGTDVFVTTSQFKGTRTSFVPMSTPTSDTSYMSGYSGGTPFYGTTNSYGTTTTMIPVNYDRYEQNGLYLKNVNHVTPLWEKKASDYKETSSSPMAGIWYNENYDLKMYKSGVHMVAFFNSIPKGKEKGQQDDIKMLFNPETGAGIYMMADRTPQPAQIKINKFGNLQVDIASQNETYSFARR